MHTLQAGKTRTTHRVVNFLEQLLHGVERQISTKKKEMVSWMVQVLPCPHCLLLNQVKETLGLRIQEEHVTPATLTIRTTTPHLNTEVHDANHNEHEHRGPPHVRLWAHIAIPHGGDSHLVSIQ